MALWRLPRPDFRRLVDTDFQDTPLALQPARSRNRQATLYTESSDSSVASAAASIASGWSEPSSRAGLSPAVNQRLSRRTCVGDLSPTTSRFQLPSCRRDRFHPERLPLTNDALRNVQALET